MNFTRVKISTTVPINHANELRQALGEAGAGTIGEYSFCSFSIVGTGRFKPSADANPTIGQPNTLEAVKEELIEVVCTRERATSVITALKAVHPYEEVIVDITPLIDEGQP